MIKQKIFKFNFSKNFSHKNFYTNSTNINAFNGIFNKINNQIILIGPKKSGKTYLGRLWIQNNNSITYNNNSDYILKNKRNLFLDDIDKVINEEEIFYLINHCLINNLNLLVTSEKKLNNLNLKLNDLTSRLKILTVLEINQPDDEMLLHILTKLFIDKQFVINSKEIFNYIIKRANRSYEEMNVIVEKLDTLSLERKRQLTIPLIKEIL